MKYRHFRMICASAGATAAIMVGATAARAQQQNEMETIIGERAAADQGRKMHVSYRDLNLTVASDERILNRRVGGAAKFVCSPADSYIGNRARDKCVSFAWNGARPQIALAVRRAREIASTGASSIPLVAIRVVGLR